MDKTFGIGSLSENNLKSKIQNLKWAGFVAILILLVVCVGIVEAQQQKKVPRIGLLTLTPPSSLAPRIKAFREALRQLGYVEGQNMTIEYRHAEGKGDRLSGLVAELVREKVDIILTMGPGAREAKRATSVVPIVFWFSGDPVEAGLIQSLARPGGNVTGMTFLAYELVGKRLELLKEAVPWVSRVAVLANPAHPGEQRELRETQTTARALGTTLQYVQVRDTADFDGAFDAMIKEKANALLVFPDGFTNAHREQIAAFATKQRLPSMFGWKEYVEAGGLMAYGPDLNESVKRIAVYIDKILKGTKPADLPVEQPTKFEFVINLKTAKQIGLTIPPNVLARADRVIR
ncbi:MAG: ABC transporter substrate-binding protein [Deltaproteobacteria bacterium]|nr:ABC transporter substrate-binding protein [Deltaproteobacteria bacterium]